MNSSVVVAPSAARTADHSVAVVNPDADSCHLVVDITAYTAGSLTVTIQGLNPATGAWYTILASAALAAAATTRLAVGRHLAASANLVANDVLPHDLRILFDHGDATSITYSAGLQLVGAETDNLVLLNDADLVRSQITITSAQLLALNTTPITLVAAPGAGKALLLEKAEFFFDFNSVAYDGIAAGEDLAIRYTNGSGTVVGACEATLFLDQITDQVRVIGPSSAVTTAAVEQVPTANAALVLHMLTGNIATGNSPLYVRVWTRTIDTEWA